MLEILTTANCPKIGAVVTVTDYLGNVHTGAVTGRDWSFDRLLAVEVGIFDAAGFPGRNVTIWAGHDKIDF